MKQACMLIIPAISTLCFSSLSTVAKANELESVENALKSGSIYIDTRYRYETVDQSNITDKAKASTLRTRLGYKTGDYRGISGQLEFENVSAIGAKNYNDGGATASKSGVPTVADPVGTELNQAFLKYDGIKGVSVKGGRHTLNRGNQRFIGSVGWRQNDQNHDGATITLNVLPDTEIFYGYSYNINRIFGDDDTAGDFSGDIHTGDITYTGLPYVKLSAFNYLIDVDTPTSQVANSSNTYGVRAWGSPEIHDGLNFLYDLSWATQSDAGNNANNYDADYWNTEVGLSYAGLTIKGGYEELGSDKGAFAFRTPLATLHKFNGWSDQFLITPNAGLEDTYIKAIYKINGVHKHLDGTRIFTAYHDFSPENSGSDYGSEINFDITKIFAEHYTVGLRYANFDSDQNGIAAGNDVEKLIFTLGIKFESLSQVLSNSEY